MMESIIDSFHDFGEIGQDPLQMTAENLQVSISDTDLNKVLSLITELPPHPDVIETLKKLRMENLQVVALSNSSTKGLNAQLEFAGLKDYFDYYFSVEEVRTYKPQALTYQYVLNKMQIAAEEACMVAAHSWDLAGAKAIGMSTIYVRRKQSAYYPLSEKPDLTVNDLREIISSII